MKWAAGRFAEAQKAIDDFEAASPDAIACLLFHGLTPSEYSEIHSTEQFIDHMETLRRYGFTFLPPSALKGLSGGGPSAAAVGSFDDDGRGREPGPSRRPHLGWTRRDGDRGGRRRGPTRRVVVTFDDARLDSMRFGTEIARAFGEPMAMHVPVGSILRKNYFIADFEQLRQYNASNDWIYGSHLLYCSDKLATDREGTLGHALNNRMWLADQSRYETIPEYRRRVEDEYKLSRDHMVREFGGTAADYDFVAYPFGNIGQEGRSNYEGAIELNKSLARRYYKIGFIQSVFGHAVAGDNPLLYQRYSVRRDETGEDVALHMIRQHPQNLAREMRLKLATLMGDYYLASDILQQFEDEAYPDPLLEELESYLNDRLAQKFWAPTHGEAIDKGWWDIAIRNPYVEGDLRWHEDANEREVWRWYVGAGADLTQNITYGLRLGMGFLEQDPVLSTNQVRFSSYTNRNLLLRHEVDEFDIGGYLAFTFPNQDFIAADWMHRDFSGDADGSEEYIQLQGKWTPFPVIELLGRYIHDIEPSALTIKEGLTYDLLQLDAVYRLTDDIDIWGNVRDYEYSDDNQRLHLMARGTYLYDEDSGLHFGARYEYTDSDFERPEYWTPADMHRFYGELDWRKYEDGWYYDLLLRGGLGRSGVTDEARERYDRIVARARREQFEPTVSEPEEKWIWIYGASATSRYQLTKSWEVNGELSYFRIPQHWEARAGAGLKYTW